MLKYDSLIPSSGFKMVNDRLKADLDYYTDLNTNLIRDDLKFEVNKCPVCSSEKREYLFGKFCFEYVRCTSCALVYVKERLNDKALEYLYSNDGRSVLQTREIYIPSAQYRMETIYKRKAKIVEELKPHGTILDFGCSAGYFMKAAEQSGLSVYGLESNSFAINWARNELGIKNVFDGGLGSIEEKNISFDAITMWDVFEHIPCPTDLITSLKKFLKTDGCIVIETSNYDCFETRHLGAENTNFCGDIHLTHFSRQTFEKIVEITDLNLISFSTFGLDIEHITAYRRKMGIDRVALPSDLAIDIQSVIDEAGEGCYIRAVLGL